jgi:hypothetical protein
MSSPGDGALSTWSVSSSFYQAAQCPDGRMRGEHQESIRVIEVGATEAGHVLSAYVSAIPHVLAYVDLPEQPSQAIGSDWRRTIRCFASVRMRASRLAHLRADAVRANRRTTPRPGALQRSAEGRRFPSFPNKTNGVVSRPITRGGASWRWAGWVRRRQATDPHCRNFMPPEAPPPHCFATDLEISCAPFSYCHFGCTRIEGPGQSRLAKGCQGLPSQFIQLVTVCRP